MLPSLETALLLLFLAEFSVVLACFADTICGRRCGPETLKLIPCEPSNDLLSFTLKIDELEAELIRMKRFHELERRKVLKLLTYSDDCWPYKEGQGPLDRIFFKIILRPISRQRSEAGPRFRGFISLPAELVLKLTNTVVLYLLLTLHLSNCLADIPKKGTFISPSDSTEQIARSEDPRVSNLWKHWRTKFFARSVKYDYRFV